MSRLHETTMLGNSKKDSEFSDELGLDVHRMLDPESFGGLGLSTPQGRQFGGTGLLQMLHMLWPKMRENIIGTAMACTA